MKRQLFRDSTNHRHGYRTASRDCFTQSRKIIYGAIESIFFRKIRRYRALHREACSGRCNIHLRVKSARAVYVRGDLRFACHKKSGQRSVTEQTRTSTTRHYGRYNSRELTSKGSYADFSVVPGNYSVPCLTNKESRHNIVIFWTDSVSFVSGEAKSGLLNRSGISTEN